MTGQLSICVVGLGSIGGRHARNAASLGANVLALRTGAAHPDTPDLGCDVTETRDIGNAIASKPALAIIANPTHLHCEYATAFAAASIPVLIEKPLSHSLDGLTDLEAALDGGPARGFIGYMMRFDPGIAALKALVDSGDLGPVHAAYIEWSTHLPAWHPWEDYKDSYAARADMGGGVVLTCSHEIDLALHLFGDCDRVFAVGGARTSLNIAAEDSVSALMQHANGIATQLSLTYAHKPGYRAIRVIGEDASAAWDFFQCRTTLERSDGTRAVVYDGGATFDVNDLYLNQLHAVLAALKSNDPTPIDYVEGRRTLDLCLAILASIQTGQPIAPTTDRKSLR